MRNVSLILPVFLSMLSPAHATDVNVVALTAGMAVVVIDGGKPRTLKTGDVTPEKVRLISATSEAAVFEIGGRRQTLGMGQSITVGAGTAGAQSTTLTADGKGHFFSVAAVNGVSIRFLIDTGASVVTIGSDDAKRAGVNYLQGEKAALQTANGVAPAYRVKFDTVRLGDITLYNVDGVVVQGNVLGGLGLLGMSFLNRTEMRRDGDTMTLTRRY